MSILHRNGTPFFPTFDGFLVPSCCKDYFLEKVLCMYQGSGEESVLRLCDFTNLVYNINFYTVMKDLF